MLATATNTLTLKTASVNVYHKSVRQTHTSTPAFASASANSPHHVLVACTGTQNRVCVNATPGKKRAVQENILIVTHVVASVPLMIVPMMKFGTKTYVNVCAAQKSALTTSSGIIQLANANAHLLTAILASIGVLTIVTVSAFSRNVPRSAETSIISIWTNVPANATVLLPLALDLRQFMTQTDANAFVLLRLVMETISGTLKNVRVFANLRFALQVCTGELTLMMTRNVAASASLTHARTATIGTKTLVDALVHPWIAQLTSTGIPISADANAILWTALVKPTSQFMTLTLAYANVLKTQQITAVQPNISTMSHAHASVPQTKLV